jgi:dTMP kinase
MAACRSDSSPRAVEFILRRFVPARVRAGFVTFEGIDGSGKTTVASLVAKRLEARGIRVFLTSEPTRGWVGDAVRRTYEADVGPLAETFLFLADRAQHLEEIRRHVDAGDVVLCDRYMDSTLAYQGARLEGVLRDPISFLRRVSGPWVLEPDLTILLRIPPDVALGRLGARARNPRFEDPGFLRKVAANYDRLARSNRFAVLDATKDAEAVADRAAGAIEKALTGRRRRR